MATLSIRLPAALLISCILASAPAFAQTEPAPVEKNGVTYVTGGIGEDEVLAFRQVAPKYNLRITLASKAGHYLSDVDVKITSGPRAVLEVQAEGPFLFVHVPAGHYRIAAQYRHLTETRDVVVPAQRGIDVHLYWDDPDRRGVTLLCRRCPKPARQ